MTWKELSFAVDGTQAEALAEALEAAGAVAVTLRPGDEADPLFEPEPGQLPLWRTLRVTGLFAAGADRAAVLARLHSALGEAQLPLPEVATLPDRDWARAWMEHFRPLCFGGRLWVCPSWHPPPHPEQPTLVLDPGLAFGTGTHPTTALCLDWLARLPDLAAARVLDYGCGSGILAVAACILGAAEAWAVDRDPQALEATRENAGRNGVAVRIHPCLPEDLPPIQADLALANILARPLMDLAPRLAERLRPGGRLALSGILEAQAGACLEAYRPWFTMGPPQSAEGWVLLEGTRLGA